MPVLARTGTCKIFSINRWICSFLLPPATILPFAASRSLASHDLAVVVVVVVLVVLLVVMVLSLVVVVPSRVASCRVGWWDNDNSCFCFCNWKAHVCLLRSF